MRAGNTLTCSDELLVRAENTLTCSDELLVRAGNTLTCSDELLVRAGNTLKLGFVLGPEVGEEEEVGGLRPLRLVLVFRPFSRVRHHLTHNHGSTSLVFLSARMLRILAVMTRQRDEPLCRNDLCLLPPASRKVFSLRPRIPSRWQPHPSSTEQPGEKPSVHTYITQSCEQFIGLAIKSRLCRLCNTDIHNIGINQINDTTDIKIIPSEACAV